MSVVATAEASLEVALRHANQLLAVDPRLADQQLDEILRVHPKHPNALLLKAAVATRQNNYRLALGLLQPLVRAHMGWADAHAELGLAFRAAGQGDQAVQCFKKSLSIKPHAPKIWLTLADTYSAMGENRLADAAYGMQLRYSDANPVLLSAAQAMTDNRLPVAERVLKDYLKQNPTDVAGIRMLAEVAARLGRDIDAENLLLRCLELAPSFHFARQNYAYVLSRNNRFAEVLDQCEYLLQGDAGNLSYLNLKAVALSKIGDFAHGIELYEQVLAQNDGYSRIWHSFGHTLKTAGYLERAIAAYRRSIALEPTYGEAYWSLANLKTFRFSEQDISEMQQQLASGELSDEDRFHFDFALGKALEDQKAFASAFQAYERGNALRKTMINYSADRNRLKLEQNKAIFDRSFFEAREAYGFDSAEPIFVLGMPRAGSTLVEQILSSHSLVEGTMELPDMIAVTKDLYRTLANKKTSTYYPALEQISEAQCRAYGQRYIENTRIHRKQNTPFFIDKMPNNYAHVALIQLLLPKAKIIDARRHPMACCFSNFKQHFARGQNFSYSLEDMGGYYRDYVELMAHFDAVLPGRIHRVHYENMVADTETEVRRLLEYCGLPFEQGCLRFFENDRPVRTASSEQVRQPIYKDGVDQWRNFEPWLQPLKTALGPVLEHYPGVPAFPVH